MPSAEVLLWLLAVQGILFLSAVLSGIFARHHLNAAHYIWMLLLPIFGPIAGWLMQWAEGRTPPDMEWIRRNTERSRELITARSSVDDIIPLEEALLMNDPGKRRNMMMNVLRADPMQYLDLLLLARFNEDSETAHYATSTIMELQRQFNLEVQQRQLEIAKDSKNFDKLKEYAQYLSRYCESGLLEGQLLRRQRLILQKAADQALALKEDTQLLSIKVRNCLALQETAEAREAAQTMIRRWPLEELPWLEAMRVCVESRDQSGMETLLEQMMKTPVDFTSKGREQMLFWTEKEK